MTTTQRRLQACEHQMRECCMWEGARLARARALVGGSEGDAPPEITECSTCGGLLLWATEEPTELLFRLYRTGQITGGLTARRKG